MSWQTNTVTFVKCDDAGHDKDPVFRIETSFAANIAQAMAIKGWTYNHDLDFHRCPKCTAKWKRRN